jgi:hypothetical protein
LLALCQEPSLDRARSALGLSEHSRVLVIVSEGVTDPQLWATKMAG